LEAANSLIASLIIRLCCQVSDPLNLSGDNINIDFKEWIEGVGEIQDLVESQIADSSSKNAVNCSSARCTETFFGGRDARQQSRLFVPRNPQLRHNPNSILLCSVFQR